MGDEVFGLAYGGAYAEFIAVSTHMLIHKPKELSWVEAAGIPEVGGSSISYDCDFWWADGGDRRLGSQRHKLCI